MKPRHPKRSGDRRPPRPCKPKVSRPSRGNSPGVPPPLRHGGKLYRFHPQLTAGHTSRDGVVFPVAAASIGDVLAACPLQMILSLRSRAAITALWMVPDDQPLTWPTVPDFVIYAAAEAVAAGHPFLLFGRDAAAVGRAAFRISAALAPPVAT
jgi:hypothetical protein